MPMLVSILIFLQGICVVEDSSAFELMYSWFGLGVGEMAEANT